LILLGLGVVAREQKRAKHASALATAVERAHDDQVKRVREPVHVVLLYLEPVE